MSDNPRECPHCGDIPSENSSCCCGWIQPHGHSMYTAALEFENASMRKMLSVVRNFIASGCPHTQEHKIIMLLDIVEAKP